jgi:hypothetical protein
MNWSRVVGAGVAAAVVVTAAVTGAHEGAVAASGNRDRTAVVLSPEGNNLDAYRAVRPFRHQRVNTNHADDPDGWDINGQVCFLGPRRFVAGEDTGQPDPPAGWGVFTLRGNRVGDLSVRRVARLVPTYSATDESPDTYGCGVLSDGRVVTTVIGNNQSGPTDGQVILWFPPFRSDTGAPFCVLDAEVGTAQGVYVDDRDRVLVASARGATAGILQYTGPFPTGPDAAGGCGRTDAAGAPLADAVARTQLVTAGGTNHLAVANGIAGTGHGGFYASSVITGVIAEFSADGAYRRTVLAPPAGETLGPEPFSTGTPLGLAVSPDGSLFYADLGLVVDGEGIGPRRGTGSVRRIALRSGRPRPPVVVADDLDFPDALGVWAPPSRSS